MTTDEQIREFLRAAVVEEKFKSEVDGGIAWEFVKKMDAMRDGRTSEHVIPLLRIPLFKLRIVLGRLAR